MSQINDLLQRLCPDGVKFRELGSVIRLNFGERITKRNNTGTLYPVYGGGGESFRTDRFNRKDEWVVSRFAISAKCVRVVSGEFWMLDSGFTFDPIDDTIAKDFVGYLLLNMQPEIYACSSQGAQKNLTTESFKALRVPVPPLEVQQEIVRILDLFVDLDTALQAELAARRTQYSYYRQTLLSLPEGTREAPISELVVSLASGKNKMRSLEGDYPVYGSTGLLGYCDQPVFSGDALLVARVGMNAGLVNAVSGDFDVSDNTLVVRPGDEWHPRFAFHQLMHMNLNQFAVGGGQPLITGGLLKRLEVPVPSIERQKLIAEDLDLFDSLVTSQSVGLPGELANRRLQYEFYRDHLLTFGEAVA